MSFDDQLLKLIKQGDKAAFEQFFQNSYMRLLNYASLFISDREIAADMVQEAFIHFWDKRFNLQSDKSIEALIFTSVRNRCLNYLRDRQTYQKHIDKYTGEVEEMQFLIQYDFLENEEESVEELLARELSNALDLLPEKCKKVFLLSKLEGKKQKEIASELGISLKAVEKHIATAKTKLREQLEKKFPALSVLISFFIEF